MSRLGEGDIVCIGLVVSLPVVCQQLNGLIHSDRQQSSLGLFSEEIAVLCDVVSGRWKNKKAEVRVEAKKRKGGHGEEGATFSTTFTLILQPGAPCALLGPLRKPGYGE